MVNVGYQIGGSNSFILVLSSWHIVWYNKNLIVRKKREKEGSEEAEKEKGGEEWEVTPSLSPHVAFTIIQLFILSIAVWMKDEWACNRLCGLSLLTVSE